MSPDARPWRPWRGALLLLAPLFAHLAAAARVRAPSPRWKWRRGRDVRGVHRRSVVEGLRLRAAGGAVSNDVLGHVLEFVSFRSQVASCNRCIAVSLWNPQGLRCSLVGHRREVLGIQFFPLGDRILTWSADKTAIVWDTASCWPLLTKRHREVVRGGKVLPSGDRCVTCSAFGRCGIWDATTGEISTISGHDLYANNVELFPTEDRVLFWGLRDAAVWDVKVGRELCSLRGFAMPADIARVSPLGNRIVSGGVDGRVIVWDATSCTVLHTINAQDWVVNLAFIAGGDALVTLSLDGVVHAWDLESGRRLLTLPDRAFDLAAFHDGLRVATLRLQEVTTWNISTGKAIRQRIGHSGLLHAIDSSPCGDVVAACRGSGGVLVWDASEGGPALELKRPATRTLSPTMAAANCLVAVGIGRALDPEGFGAGATWRSIAAARRAALG